LLAAERGVDVESIAREIHERARRPSATFIHVACSSGDPARLDSAVFGTAPDNAPSDLEWASRDSLLAAACGGTLFLQDVVDLPAAVQARLARVARDGEVRLDGQPVATSLRFVASAAPGLEAEVHANRFRSDLYRRLSTSRIDLPQLRERPDDVPALATRILDDWCASNGVAPRTFTQTALALLAALTWPGNVIELKSVVERAAKETTHDVIQIEDVLPALNLDRAPARFTPAGQLREARLRFERDYISAVLQHHGWRMADAAETLGIQRPNLYRKARQLGIPLTRASE
ncbi:MAG TPA: sigma 54-interacting transcriptional regulator, partial [Vicinamibacterales bacterium]|nr:sigma 54-interacting transcriptional regulator [Vicinamibacterales bacterium]